MDKGGISCVFFRCMHSSCLYTRFSRWFYADDFATADVEKGTGGIDASIGFETLRPENSGSAMNDSLAFFAPYVNAHTSSECPLALSTYDHRNTDYNDDDDLSSVRPHSSQRRDGSRCLQRSPNPTSRRSHRCHGGRRIRSAGTRVEHRGHSKSSSIGRVQSSGLHCAYCMWAYDGFGP